MIGWVKAAARAAGNPSLGSFGILLRSPVRVVRTVGYVSSLPQSLGRTSVRHTDNQKNLRKQGRTALLVALKLLDREASGIWDLFDVDPTKHDGAIDYGEDDRRNDGIDRKDTQKPRFLWGTFGRSGHHLTRLLLGANTEG